MIRKLRNRLKEQKGMTLIELLAVIVILGIIAAIAIPSIMGIINNTKKDAHVANAQQMVAAARNAVANGAKPTPTTGNDTIIKLDELVSLQFMERPDDPTDTHGYDGDASRVVVSLGANDKLIYTVTLKGAGASGTNGTLHISGITSNLLARGIVTP